MKIALSIVFCLISGVSAHAEELVIGGTGMAIALARQLGGAYSAMHAGVTVTVPASVGTSGAINAVAAGSFGLGFSARSLSEDERARGLIAETFIRTPFVFAASPQMTGDAGFDTDAIIRAYSAADSAWPDGTRIRPVLRTFREANTALLIEHFPALKPVIEHALEAKGALIALSDQDAMTFGEEVKGALVTGGLLAIRAEKRKLAPIAVNGVRPTVASMSDGTYPMSVTLWLIQRTDASTAVRMFADFLRSPAAADIVRAHDGLPVLH